MYIDRQSVHSEFIRIMTACISASSFVNGIQVSSLLSPMGYTITILPTQQVFKTSEEM
jgi:hypothetical protein